KLHGSGRWYVGELRGGPVLRDLPMVGRMFVDASRDSADPIDEPEPMQIESRDDVQNWVRAILGCQTVSIGGKTLELRSGLGLDLHLRLPDGRELISSESGVKSDGEQVVLIGGVSLLAAPPLEELLAAGVASIRRAAQLRRGIALSRDYLRALPATATAIQMPPFDAATLRAELPAFSALEQLADGPVGLSQL